MIFLRISVHIMIRHELAAPYGLNHAKTLAVMLPSVMNIFRGENLFNTANESEINTTIMKQTALTMRLPIPVLFLNK